MRQARVDQRGGIGTILAIVGGLLVLLLLIGGYLAAGVVITADQNRRVSAAIKATNDDQAQLDKAFAGSSFSDFGSSDTSATTLSKLSSGRATMEAGRTSLATDRTRVNDARASLKDSVLTLLESSSVAKQRARMDYSAQALDAATMALDEGIKDCDLLSAMARLSDAVGRANTAGGAKDWATAIAALDDAKKETGTARQIADTVPGPPQLKPYLDSYATFVADYHDFDAAVAGNNRTEALRLQAAVKTDSAAVSDPTKLGDVGSWYTSHFDDLQKSYDDLVKKVNA